MKSRSQQAGKQIATVAICAALLLVVQLAMAPLANIELVTTLILLYTLFLRFRVLYVIYIFVLLEGMIFGFHIWWISYLYIWTILAGIGWLCRAIQSPLGWAVVAGTYGLLFGALCAIPYFLIGGPAMAAAYWISGIPFDLAHGAGNFVLNLFLWRPLRAAMSRFFTQGGFL